MAKITIPFMVPKRNKGGITSWHWQPSAALAKAGFKSEPLGKDLAAAMARAQDLNKDVEAWRAGGAPRAELKPHVATGTINHLMERYRKERVYGINEATRQPWVRASTAAGYETALKRIEIWAGKQAISYVTPERVKVLRREMLHPDTGIGHAPALNVLRTLRQLFKFAKSVNLATTNPAENFELAPVAARKAIWEHEDEAAFIQAAYALNKPSMALAMELALYTAQREADLIAMNENQIQTLPLHDVAVMERLADKDGQVRGWNFAQAKSNKTTIMEIPLEPTILAKVQSALRTNRARDRAAVPQRLTSCVLIDDATGLPWHLYADRHADNKVMTREGEGAKRAFIKAWTKVAKKAAEETGRAHMTDLVWHDLRRTRVVRLRRRGMPKEMIATITGHKLRSIEMMLEVYGPIDPTITAHAIASTLPPRETPTDLSNEDAKQSA